jgi:hypothetical protein
MPHWIFLSFSATDAHPDNFGFWILDWGLGIGDFGILDFRFWILDWGFGIESPISHLKNQKYRASKI